MNKNLEPEVVDDFNAVPRQSKVLGIVKNVGFGSAIFGAYWASCLFSVFQLLFVALAGFAMLGLTYNFFVDGSYFFAALTLFIGTPLAVGLAHYSFILWAFVAVISGIIFLILIVVGLDVTFDTVMAAAWRLGWALALLWCWYSLMRGAVLSVRQKRMREDAARNCFLFSMLVLISVLTVYAWLTPEEPYYSDNEIAMYELCMSTDKSKESFVSAFNNIFIEYTAYNYLNEAMRSDSVVLELERLGMIGVTIKDSNIYMSNSLISVAEENNEFEVWQENTKEQIRTAQLEEDDVSDVSKCIYQFIISTFDNIILRGPEGLEVTIPIHPL